MSKLVRLVLLLVVGALWSAQAKPYFGLGSGLWLGGRYGGYGVYGDGGYGVYADGGYRGYGNGGYGGYGVGGYGGYGNVRYGGYPLVYY